MVGLERREREREREREERERERVFSNGILFTFFFLSE